jgi:hypothetical protein
MTTLFQLSNEEVDFTYLSCVGGILLSTRMPPPTNFERDGFARVGISFQYSARQDSRREESI